MNSLDDFGLSLTNCNIGPTYKAQWQKHHIKNGICFTVFAIFIFWIYRAAALAARTQEMEKYKGKKPK